MNYRSILIVCLATLGLAGGKPTVKSHLSPTVGYDIEAKKTKKLP